MADTRPNIVVPASTPINIYAATGSHPQGPITVGTRITVQMIGDAYGKLYAGAALTGEPDNETGFRPIGGDEEWANDEGDSGAWIWSRQGCIINVEVA